MKAEVRQLTTPLSHGKGTDDSHGEHSERHVLWEDLLEVRGEWLALFLSRNVRDYFKQYQSYLPKGQVFTSSLSIAASTSTMV